MHGARYRTGGTTPLEGGWSLPFREPTARPWTVRLEGRPVWSFMDGQLGRLVNAGNDHGGNGPPVDGHGFIPLAALYEFTAEVQDGTTALVGGHGQGKRGHFGLMGADQSCGKHGVRWFLGSYRRRKPRGRYSDCTGEYGRKE